MKKLILLILIATLSFAGCSKNNSGDTQPQTTTGDAKVVYTFTASITDAYTIAYYDQNMVQQIVQVAGKSWSKTIDFPSISALSPALFQVSTFSGHSDPITVSITVNGKVVKNGSYTLSSSLPFVQLMYF